MRAPLLAETGELAEAESLAREALALLDSTDQVNERASCLAALGDVLDAGGRHAERDAARDEARELFLAKGNLVAASRLS